MQSSNQQNSSNIFTVLPLNNYNNNQIVISQPSSIVNDSKIHEGSTFNESNINEVSCCEKFCNCCVESCVESCVELCSIDCCCTLCCICCICAVKAMCD